MKKFKIIGNMTGNSMDAIDLVLTEFEGDKITDICSFSKPYSKNMQQRIEKLRTQSRNKTAAEIAALPDFQAIHDDYVRQIAECINEMCNQENIDKNEVDAIGFHGKTLDHNPPSKAKIENTLPYTLQIGSGQMLADLTQIPVVYDFRSDPLIAGFDGAPLAAAHNAHISASEGDGIYYNGGNTSNFAIIDGGNAQISSDSGPFNEYTDNFVRLYSNESFDENGHIGKNGTLNPELLQKIYELGQNFFEAPLPKSGDPAYYHKSEIFEFAAQSGIKFADCVKTFEYSAAYWAAYALSLVPNDIKIPSRIILFGGGWKNPIARQSFENLLGGNGFILPQHQKNFTTLKNRFAAAPLVKQSTLGDFMEARLFADLARYKLENKAWEIPEIVSAGKNVICGITATPKTPADHYSDCINRAAKGWQEKSAHK